MCLSHSDHAHTLYKYLEYLRIALKSFCNHQKSKKFQNKTDMVVDLAIDSTNYLVAYEFILYFNSRNISNDSTSQINDTNIRKRCHKWD